MKSQKIESSPDPGRQGAREDAGKNLGRSGIRPDRALGAFPIRAKAGEDVGLPGRKRAGMVKSAQFRPLKCAKNRLGPPWPTFAHIDFF